MLNRFINKISDSDSNSKIVLINVFGAFVVKGAALIVTLLTIPAYIRFFNDNMALGVWYTLLSVITWILNFDLGIGNGLRNKLTEALAKNDIEASKRYISSAYYSIGLLAIIGSVIAFLTFDSVNWNMVFNIDETTISSTALCSAMKIIFVGIMAQFLIKLISSILYSLQLSSVNNALALATSIIILLYVVFAPSGSNDENVVVMAIVHAIAVLIPLVIATIIVFATKLKDAKPSSRFFDLKHAKAILGLGGVFFVVQIAYMILINTNEYFITYLVNSASVVDYQIYYKLFTLIGTLATLALTPIWSAITKAFSEENYRWIKSLYTVMMRLGGLCCFFEFVFIIFIQFVVNIWLGENAIVIDYYYSFAFAILGSCMVMNGVLSSFANGIGKLTPQIVCFGLGALLKIPLCLLFVKLTHSWIGVIISVDIAMIFFVLIQSYANQKVIKQFNVENNLV